MENKPAKYSPDSWAVLVITNTVTNEKTVKVLGGWSGGYLDGSYWRLCSGVSKVEEEDDSWYITNHSGSTYRVRKTAIRVSSIMAGTYHKVTEIPEKYPEYTVERYGDSDDEPQIRKLFEEYK